jgi:aspartate-semialdehyde dehydrogenase
VTSLALPSAPIPPIVIAESDDRPQPRRDADTGGGMTTVVGRVRRDPILDLRMVALSHNLVRGAAGASVLNAELLVARGLVRDAQPAVARAGRRV